MSRGYGYLELVGTKIPIYAYIGYPHYLYICLGFMLLYWLMKIKEIKAGDFPTRSDLENHIRSKYGLTTESKEAEIVGTEQELKKLQLSHGNIVWGIIARTESVGVKPQGEKVARGKRTDFGIENRETMKKTI